MSRYPAKPDHLSDILDLHPDTERRCAGYAPSQGRRCHNPINAANRTSAVHLLDEGSRRMKRGEDLSDLLMDLASLVLCRHVHQKGQRSQVPGLVKKWQGRILGVTENLDNVETIYGGREVKHVDIRGETNELETSRRVERFSLSSRLQPSWHGNLLLQVDVEASRSSKLEVDRRARPSGSNEGNTRRARVSSAGVSGAITTTSSQHAASITEQPRSFTAPAPTLRASTPSSPSSSSPSRPSRPSPLTLSTSNSSPTTFAPMVNPRATIAPASSSRAPVTTSMSISTSTSTSTSTSIASPTSARSSPSRATTSISAASSRVPVRSRSDTTSTTTTVTITGVTLSRTITPSNSSSASTAAPTTSASSPRDPVNNVEPEASASDPTSAAARPRAASITASSTSVPTASSTSVPTALASTTTARMTSEASSTSDPTYASTATPTDTIQTANPTANATPDPTTTTSQPETSSSAVALQPPHSSSSTFLSSPTVLSPPPFVPNTTYTPTRQPITGDCSICYEPLLPDSPFTTPRQAARDLSIVYCKQQCGTNFHFSCLFTWKKSASQMNREPTCPMCRAAWP